ncbi:ABC transporter permease [Nocardia otitidiscaviarum]|uniref:ABC transporter permease n=1 Tax=Nocardia otitidiscaviarum TaxID=1823 RepID=A0A516NP06_9NOCA|nr:ABC transporter permease [Nocardia otitidiscaviarum]MCP9624126.1 ABC transporter permease [Nocardia otitidiscaviarum]QDP80629.1 ABC transporter permease [Nocardia otitidiscaviarum]
MIAFAARNLAKERMRLAISVGGVALAVMLIVLLRGLYVSYENKVSGYFERIPAQLWVVQQGTADFFHSYSIVADGEREQIAATPGVTFTYPYLARQVGFTLHGEPALLYLVGFDPTLPVAGPAQLESGSAAPNDSGIIVDQVFAAEHGVHLGDDLVLNGITLRVTGISSGGDMVMFQYAYVTTATARQVLSMPDTDNGILVGLAPDADRAAVIARIEALSPQLSVRDTASVVAANQRVITGSFLPVITVLLIIGFAVGVAVVGLTIYSAVLEKRREYGVLKALGARARQLTVTVAAQALIAALAGYAAGIGLAVAARSAAKRWVPAFVSDIVAADLAWIAAATVAMAVVASLIPLARIARIDPAEVFRS